MITVIVIINIIIVIFHKNYLMFSEYFNFA